MVTLLWILSLAALGLTFWAQFRVKGTFRKWAQEPASSGLTGAEVARRILDSNGLHDVAVEPVPGELTDHYDPIHRVVRLSEPVYYDSSIAAISVAAHECGHAIQHKEAYGALVLRHRMFPVVNFASSIAPFLLMGGIFLHMLNLFALGIVFFSAAVAFQLVTLPVEFNASSRAKQIMIRDGYIRNLEERGVSKVLNAAALTYVASALYALLELFRFVAMLVVSQNDD
ncbi:putative membrane protease YugP [Polycladomyces abyssicola]|uniref:Putative membrane protease YugP n=1 Tax=Polycladomyces abyssicola TaxID=1125966 RepID=A0A8D5UH73_9BACL|nr:zinc metallopeptidase [Polycladomyces abyssicola]BCU82371.1 putative membrane protease YugP [Polycladomyces abyssicola]